MYFVVFSMMMKVDPSKRSIKKMISSLLVLLFIVNGVTFAGDRQYVFPMIRKVDLSKCLIKKMHMILSLLVLLQMA